MMDDVRRSKLDYSMIFDGFGNLDAAVPFEELVAKPGSPIEHRQEKRRLRRRLPPCWRVLRVHRDFPISTHPCIHLSSKRDAFNLSYGPISAAGLMQSAVTPSE